MTGRKKGVVTTIYDAEEKLPANYIAYGHRIEPGDTLIISWVRLTSKTTNFHFRDSIPELKEYFESFGPRKGAQHETNGVLGLGGFGKETA